VIGKYSTESIEIFMVIMQVTICTQYLSERIQASSSKFHALISSNTILKSLHIKCVKESKANFDSATFVTIQLVSLQM
jgi:hypothetical protein